MPVVDAEVPRPRRENLHEFGAVVAAFAGELDEFDRFVYEMNRLEAVRGHLLELAGDLTAARNSYQRAARMTASIPEQRYLVLRAARLAD